MDERGAARLGWYALFSRGEADWLRLSETAAAAIRSQLPDLLGAAELIDGARHRKLRLPLQLPEHMHFSLLQGPLQTGAGQGEGQPGELLRAAPAPSPGTRAGGYMAPGGSADGGITLQVEMSAADMLDLIWRELRLPLLRPAADEWLGQPGLQREGWNKRGARSRLDRRRTLKEAIRRRSLQPQGPAFSNDDLRFRQLRQGPAPGPRACVFFVLDVSASMGPVERKLAKAFFYCVLHGLRQRYQQLDVHFLAHASAAWEFAEEEFFQVCGSGGTLASSAFTLALQLLGSQAGAGRNAYLFYASDGENFIEDRVAACHALATMTRCFNFLGYVEVLPGMPRMHQTEMRRLWDELVRHDKAAGASTLTEEGDIWQAIHQFFNSPAMTAQPAC
ncbi:DUF444 family protein [Oxalobacteraceae bacterium]|nr:DUF444 family protein [Oxalobacteraceae bacterium]